MSRKETSWRAGHKKGEEELQRIILEYKKKLNMDIKKIEADYIMAARSQKAFMNNSELRDYIMRLRGLK